MLYGEEVCACGDGLDFGFLVAKKDTFSEVNNGLMTYFAQATTRGT